MSETASAWQVQRRTSQHYHTHADQEPQWPTQRRQHPVHPGHPELQEEPPEGERTTVFLGEELFCCIFYGLDAESLWTHQRQTDICTTISFCYLFDRLQLYTLMIAVSSLSDCLPLSLYRLCLTACLSLCICLCLTACLSLCIVSVWLPASLFVSASVCLSASVSVCLSQLRVNRLWFWFIHAAWRENNPYDWNL